MDDLAPTLAGKALIVGFAGFGAAVVMGLLSGNSESFFRGYVMNFAYFASITLGSLFFVLIQHVTRAGWSVVVRRLAENVSMIFPTLALLSLVIILPILLGFPGGIHSVYPWTDPELRANDELIRHKSAYLNGGFFLIRMAVYFGLWTMLAGYYYRSSVRQDQSGDPAVTSTLQVRAAPSLIIFALSLTYFAFDVLMSLSPHWYSTIFGVYFFAGSAVSFFCVLTLLMFWLQSVGRLQSAITSEHYHDVGKLIFAFIVFWAYIGFSQYMLIWYGNIPEETGWYLIRQQSPWLYVTLLLLFGHFMLPFVALISRHPKRRKSVLILGAMWMLLMHWFDMMWLTFPHPTSHGGEPVAAPLAFWDVAQAAASLVGVGGVCAWALLNRMSAASLIPERDPRLTESLAFQNY